MKLQLTAIFLFLLLVKIIASNNTNTDNCCHISSKPNCNKNEQCKICCKDGLTPSCMTFSGCEPLCTCSQPECRSYGETCKQNSDCCVTLCRSQQCENGTCINMNSMCRKTKAPCRYPCQCCSNNCIMENVQQGYCG